MSATETQTSIPAEILSAALALNEAQRLELGHRLIESVEDDRSPPFPGWPADWEEELERRALEVERGGPTYSLEEVLAHARASIKDALEARAAKDKAS